MINHPDLQEYQECYAEMEFVPLRLRVRLCGPLAGYDYVHLDNLLAWLIIEEATDGRGLPDSDEPYHIPLPLKRLWASDSGLPLWAATDFLPDGKEYRYSEHWHKRAPQPRLVRKRQGKPWAIRTTEGRFKELRIPMPARRTANGVYIADAIGNLNEIVRLLSHPALSHLGKKRSQGMGAILEWSVETADDFSLIENSKARRPIPTGAAMQLYGRTIFNTTLMGWTPPYWLPICQGMCIATGGELI